MKPTRLFAIALPALLGVAAARWTPLALWFDMKEGLIAFLGFLAASLVQVMPLTANFLQSDRLSPEEARRLTQSLTRQQHYWMGLLAATIGAMVVVIVGAALKDRASSLPLLIEHHWSPSISWAAAISFSIVSSVSFVLVKMLGLFEGMLSLHRLRGELVIASAQRAADEKIAALQAETQIPPSIVPPDYGSIVRPH